MIELSVVDCDGEFGIDGVDERWVDVGGVCFGD